MAEAKRPGCRAHLARAAWTPEDPANPANLRERFYYADLLNGQTFDVPFAQVAAIHKVIGGFN